MMSESYENPSGNDPLSPEEIARFRAEHYNPSLKRSVFEEKSIFRSTDERKIKKTDKAQAKNESARTKAIDKISGESLPGTIDRLGKNMEDELSEAYPYPRPKEESEYQEIHSQQWDNTCTFAAFVNIINSFGRLPETDLNNLEETFQVAAGDDLKDVHGITWDKFKNFIGKTGYKAEAGKTRADWFSKLKTGGGAIVKVVTEKGNYHAKAVIVVNGELLLVDPEQPGKREAVEAVQAFELSRVGLDQLLTGLGVHPEDKEWITKNVLVFDGDKNYRKESIVKPTDRMTEYEKAINDYVSGGTDIAGTPLENKAERKQYRININQEYKLAQQALTAEEQEQIKTELKEYYDRYHYPNAEYNDPDAIKMSSGLKAEHLGRLDKAFENDLERAVVSYAYLKTILSTPEKRAEQTKYIESQLGHYSHLDLDNARKVIKTTAITSVDKLTLGQRAKLRIDFDKKNPIYSPYLKLLRTRQAVRGLTNTEQDYLIKHGNLKMGVERPAEKPEPSVLGSLDYDNQEKEWVAGANNEFVGARKKKSNIEQKAREIRKSFEVTDSGALRKQLDQLSDQQKISELKHQLGALFSGGQKEGKTTKPTKKIEDSPIGPETLPGAEQIVLPNDQELVEFLGEKLDKYYELYEQGDKKTEQKMANIFALLKELVHEGVIDKTEFAEEMSRRLLSNEVVLDHGYSQKDQDKYFESAYNKVKDYVDNYRKISDQEKQDRKQAIADGMFAQRGSEVLVSDLKPNMVFEGNVYAPGVQTPGWSDLLIPKNRPLSQEEITRIKTKFPGSKLSVGK
nr:hypothetical protein [uncultured bacterium]AQS31004.1 hypothetical protein [uncultured bacterium]